MAIPFNYGYPVLRPGVVVDASFQGSDANLNLNIVYYNEFGATEAFVMPCCSVAHGMGLICLPSSATIQDVNRDAIVASVRMATLISSMIPGSSEWNDAITTDGGLLNETMDFQMSIGNVKVKTLRVVTDSHVELDMVKKGTTSPVQTIVTDYDELGRYTFAPDAQLHCVAGAIEKQFPTYVHDPANNVLLTQARKDEIVAYVKTLVLWV